jgi:hypothetical protein
MFKSFFIGKWFRGPVRARAGELTASNQPEAGWPCLWRAKSTSTASPASPSRRPTRLTRCFSLAHGWANQRSAFSIWRPVFCSRGVGVVAATAILFSLTTGMLSGRRHLSFLREFTRNLNDVKNISALRSMLFTEFKAIQHPSWIKYF